MRGLHTDTEISPFVGQVFGGGEGSRTAHRAARTSGKAAYRLDTTRRGWGYLTFHNRHSFLNTLSGSVSTSVIRQQMKKSKTKDVVAVIDRWNHVSQKYQLQAY